MRGSSYGAGLQPLHRPSSSTLSRYWRTVETYAAWLHARGVAEIASPVRGLSCSGRTPEESACFATQEKISRTRSRSFSPLARAIKYSAYQSVAIIHGLLGEEASLRKYSSPS